MQTFVQEFAFKAEIATKVAGMCSPCRVLQQKKSVRFCWIFHELRWVGLSLFVKRWCFFTIARRNSNL